MGCTADAAAAAVAGCSEAVHYDRRSVAEMRAQGFVAAVGEKVMLGSSDGHPFRFVLVERRHFEVTRARYPAADVRVTVAVSSDED